MVVVKAMAKQSHGGGGVVDPEVPAKASRRTFSGRYKLDILERADACTKEGDIGELLRKEGLYSSHLSTWRRQREEGALSSLGKKRGRKSKPVSVASSLLRCSHLGTFV